MRLIVSLLFALFSDALSLLGLRDASDSVNMYIAITLCWSPEDPVLSPWYAVWEQRVPAGGSASFGDLAPEIASSGLAVPCSCVSRVICQFACVEMELLSL